MRGRGDVWTCVSSETVRRKEKGGEKREDRRKIGGAEENKEGK